MALPPSNSVSTHTLRLKADAASMKRGLQAVDDQLAKVVVQLDRQQAAAAKARTQNARLSVENAKLAQAARKNAAAVQKQTDERLAQIERLSMKYKPLYAASKQYERALEEINEAQRLGVLTTAQYEAQLESLNREFTEFQKGTAGWTNQFVTGATRGKKSVNLLGMQMQQTGYQVQDFIVQVQSGTSAFVALGQQGSQLLGVLGGAKGAIAGAVLALGTAVGRILWDMVAQANAARSELEKEVEAIRKKMADSASELEALRMGVSPEELVLWRQIQQAQQDVADAMIAVNNADVEGYQMAQNRLDQAQEAVKAAEAELEAYREQQKALKVLEALNNSEVLEAENLRKNRLRQERERKKEQDEQKERLRRIRIIMMEIQAETEAQLRLEAQISEQRRLQNAITIDNAKNAKFYRDEEEAMAQTVGMTAEQLEASRQRIAQILQQMQAQQKRAEQIAAAARMLNNALDGTKTRLDSLISKSKTFGQNLLTAAGALFQAAVDRVNQQPERDARQQMQVMLEWGAELKALEDKLKDKDDTTSSAKDTTDEYTEALKRAQEQAEQFGESMDNALGTLASNALDSFIDGLVTGEMAFKDFARSILNDLAKIMLRALIVQTLLSAFGVGVQKTDNLFHSVLQQMAGITPVEPNAKGNIISGGDVVPFAKGGVISSPAMFPLNNGTGLMGEAGPEVIAPLRRDGSGNMGVSAVAPVVNIYNNTGAGVDVQQNPDGSTDVIIGKAVKASEAAFARSMATGQGTYARALESGFHARRKAT